MGVDNIEHLVVVMFENRSSDNLLGWLYDNQANPPKHNLPPPGYGISTAHAAYLNNELRIVLPKSAL